MLPYIGDVPGAYLNAEMREAEPAGEKIDEVYATQPEGYEVYGPNGERLVYRLRRALYGGKSSGRAWGLHLKKRLLSYGFIQCIFDLSLIHI